MPEATGVWDLGLTFVSKHELTPCDHNLVVKALMLCLL